MLVWSSFDILRTWVDQDEDVDDNAEKAFAVSLHWDLWQSIETKKNAKLSTVSYGTKSNVW